MTFLTKHCLLCGANERIQELYPRTFSPEDLTPEVFSARRVTEHFHYAIVRCLNCGLIFSREILPDETLASLYAQSTVTFAEYTDIIRRDYWRCIAPYLDGSPKEAALEIGCSNGFFLEELLSRGFGTVAGCEPSIEAKARSSPAVRDAITTEFFREGLYGRETFDLVCSFQTLDHLSDPVSVLRTSRDILKPGGLVYFITHNTDGLQAKLLGEKSPIIDVEHIYLFNKRTMRRLLDQCGFEVLAVSDVKNNYPLDYWLRMFPMAGRRKDRLRALFRSIGLGSVAVPLRAGNMFVVARRPR